MDDISIDLLLQMTDDELAEVLEELSGVEFEDAQMAPMRSLIQAAGSLEGALDLLEGLDQESRAA